MTTRLDVTFRSGDATCSAWLYLPDTGQPAPVVVMAHGLGGTRQMRLDAFAERFSAAGYACLLFDYRHFGSSEGEPRQLLDVGRQLADWAAAIAFARSRSDVDAGRIVLWGTSFSGGHVVTTAARDGAIAAVVAQCPFTDGLAAIKAMSPLSSVKVVSRAVADVVSARLGRRPVMVALAGLPHSTALMAGDGVEAAMTALVPGGEPYVDEVTARFALTIGLLRPGRHAARVTCPVLFCVCDKDSVTPPEVTVRHASRAPRGEVRRYPEGHFDIYLGDAFERVVGDQIDFLHKHVPVAQPTDLEAINGHG